MDMYMNQGLSYKVDETSSGASPDSKLENSNRQKRRPRNECVNRDFTCGCGKSYLSYPALYTHVKTKHDGKFPEGTVNPSQSSSKTKNKVTDIILQRLNFCSG